MNELRDWHGVWRRTERLSENLDDKLTMKEIELPTKFWIRGNFKPLSSVVKTKDQNRRMEPDSLKLHLLFK